MRNVYRVGRVLAYLVQACAIVAAEVRVGFYGPSSHTLLGVGQILIVGYLGCLAAVVVHEAGHALACRALGATIRAIYIGNGLPNSAFFTVGKLAVSLRPFGGGRVMHDETGSAARNALIVATGPLANLIVAATLLAVFWLDNAMIFGFSLIMAGIGLSNLLPYRSRSGRPTDGARLLALAGGSFAEAVRPRIPLIGDIPAEVRAELNQFMRDVDGSLQPNRTNKWLAAYYRKEPAGLLAVGVIGRALRREGRITDLLALNADLVIPTTKGPSQRVAHSMSHMLSWEILLLPGLPPEATERAVARVQWFLDNFDFEQPKATMSQGQVLHTLALGKLRQGQFAAVEELCQPALANPQVPAAYQAGARATILATIALARMALGQPYEQPLAEAIGLAPNADLVPEAAAAAAGPTGDCRFPTVKVR